MIDYKQCLSSLYKVPVVGNEKSKYGKEIQYDKSNKAWLNPEAILVQNSNETGAITMLYRF